MFEDYLYVSSASDTLKDHLWDLSDIVVQRRDLGEGDLVIDIGSNDGTLLKGFRPPRRPARSAWTLRENLVELATHGRRDRRYVGFFNSGSRDEIVERWGPASAITATNTFPHIPALHDFVEGIDTALAPAGRSSSRPTIWSIMLEQGAFDTIYHEHVSYWALGPMMRLFERHGLEVVDAERAADPPRAAARAGVQRQGEGEVQHERGRDPRRARTQTRARRLETFQRFADAGAAA